MNAPLLQVHGLDLILPGGRQVLRGLDFDIAVAGRLGLVGESGSGKSLTAAALIGLPPPGARLRAEQLRYHQRDLLKLGSGARRRLRGRDIALVSQNGGNALNPVRRIGDQVGATLRRLRDLSTRQAMQRGLDWFERLGLADAERCWQAFPHQLSGGQNNRVVLAMALACEPRLLIADEPTAALDTVSRAHLTAALRDASRQSGMALLLITHDLALVAECVDDVALIYAGQIVESGPATQVLAAPRHPYSQALTALRLDRLPGANRRATLPGLPPLPGQWPAGCAFHPRCGQRLACCSDRVPQPWTFQQQTTRCHLAHLATG